jgi:hypothetical protein
MDLKINGQNLPITPSAFEVTILDLDDADNTFRTSDGQFSRERVATKRQIAMEFNAMTTDTLKTLHDLMTNEKFTFTYFDPYAARMVTKSFYVGDRKVGVALIVDGVYYWQGLSITFTEY